MGTTLVGVFARLPESIAKKLDEMKLVGRRSKASIIEQALTEYIDRWDKRRATQRKRKGAIRGLPTSNVPSPFGSRH